MNNLVSIIMPAYNCEKYIKNSIESVLNQTYENWELIIVDDCSTDNTVGVIKEFNDKRIKLFQNKANSGAAFSRNWALREARGKWIAFLDADDVWVSVKLDEQLHFMIMNNYSFSYTDYRICKNGKWEKYVRIGPNVVDFKKLHKYCYFFTSTVMYDRTTIGLIQIGDIKKNNDYAMWLKALKNREAHRYSKCLSYYIKHYNSISTQNRITLIKWHYALFKNECGYNTIKSLLLTIGNLWHGFWKKINFKKRITRYYN